MIDAQLHLGWMFAALLGAAPEWRPIEWITGDSGTGKSTLMKLTRWVLGEHAMITSEDATAAGIKRRVANSALPVSLDEQESDGAGGNRKVQELIKLARIASSGGAVGARHAGRGRHLASSRATASSSPRS
jgi:ABC-type cobalamin/Fe3+-siderophores transport system ATPase subunit